jgi:hypothetical protein
MLVISAVQRVTAEQAKLGARRVRELLQDVAPGFRVLADYRWLESMDSAAARHIAEIMDALADKGVASVTRVVPDPRKDIGLNILSQFHYGPEIKITTFETLADALQTMAGAC